MAVISKTDQALKSALMAYVLEFLEALKSKEQGYSHDDRLIKQLRARIDGVLDGLQNV
jgi:hypothetical protein